MFKIKFSGVNYHGWQVQKNALTIQEVFQDAIEKVIKKRLDIKACSRTDSGVHANMFCVNALVEHKISSDDFMLALNRVLPSDISVFECKNVPLDFHARYSCVAKEYVYKILNSKIRNPFLHGYALHYWYDINIKSLQKASDFFVGSHDFSSFCTLDSRKKGDFVRTLEYFKIEKQDNIIMMRVKANGFLYNMVRIMVGTLLRVAQGKINSFDIPKIIKAKRRKIAGPTVDSCGLYLNKVFYCNQTI